MRDLILLLALILVSAPFVLAWYQYDPDRK